MYDIVAYRIKYKSHPKVVRVVVVSVTFALAVVVEKSCVVVVVQGCGAVSASAPRRLVAEPRR